MLPKLSAICDKDYAMNHVEFREALEELDLTQVEFARLTGKNPRTIRGYALGEDEIPRIVELVLLLFLRHPKDVKHFVRARELLDDEL